MPTVQDLLSKLESACKDLLWRSETDSPFEVTVFPSSNQSLSIDRLLANYPDDIPVTTISLDDFFSQVTKQGACHDSGEATLAQRYRHLQDLLETTLENPQGYQIGSVEIDIYLIGKTEDGQMIGVKTTIVET